MNALDVMTRAPATIPPAATLDEARYRLRAMGVRHLPVVAPAEGLVGIISVRDLVAPKATRWDAAAPVDGTHRIVASVMSTSVVVVTPETPLREIARLMVEHHVGAIPVVARAPAEDPDAADEVVGIVSYEDLLRSMTW